MMEETAVPGEKTPGSDLTGYNSVNPLIIKLFS